ncbi:MAG: hypothetical protein J6Y92_07855 [Lentisphaeria bacterium]|nr:hypothetical protein [Lentisphaeria bacterium]
MTLKKTKDREAYEAPVITDIAPVAVTTGAGDSQTPSDGGDISETGGFD